MQPWQLLAMQTGAAVLLSVDTGAVQAVVSDHRVASTLTLGGAGVQLTSQANAMLGAALALDLGLSASQVSLGASTGAGGRRLMQANVPVASLSLMLVGFGGDSSSGFAAASLAAVTLSAHVLGGSATAAALASLGSSLTGATTGQTLAFVQFTLLPLTGGASSAALAAAFTASYASGSLATQLAVALSGSPFPPVPPPLPPPSPPQPPAATTTSSSHTITIAAAVGGGGGGGLLLLCVVLAGVFLCRRSRQRRGGASMPPPGSYYVPPSWAGYPPGHAVTPGPPGAAWQHNALYQAPAGAWAEPAAMGHPQQPLRAVPQNMLFVAQVQAPALVVEGEGGWPVGGRGEGAPR